MRPLFYALLILSASFLAAAEPQPKPPLNAPEYRGEMPTQLINESSGIIRSRRHPEKSIFWTHNDSGDSARIFAVSGEGELLREVKVPNAKNYDWEEISIDDKGRIVVCDIGDNFKKRDTINLYRFSEPDALNENEPIRETQAFHYRYPKGDGPYDAEALVIAGDNAYLFTKDVTKTRVYRLPLPVIAKDEVIEAEFFCETNTFSVATAASLTEDHMHLALISYLSIMVLDLPEPLEKMPDGGKKMFDAPRRVRIALLGQTEGVTWDKNDLVLTTEGGAVYRVKDALPKP